MFLNSSGGCNSYGPFMLTSKVELCRAKTENIDFTVESKIVAQRVGSNFGGLHFLLGLELIGTTLIRIGIKKTSPQKNSVCTKNWNPNKFQPVSISPMEDELIHHFVNS